VSMLLAGTVVRRRELRELSAPACVLQGGHLSVLHLWEVLHLWW